MPPVAMSKQSIEEAAKRPLTDADVALAKKKIREMNSRGANIELDMHAVTMYHAIRTVKEESNRAAGRNVQIRVAPEALRHWVTQVYRSVSMVEEYYIVPKENVDLDKAPDIKNAIMDPTEFE